MTMQEVIMLAIGINNYMFLLSDILHALSLVEVFDPFVSKMKLIL